MISEWDPAKAAENLHIRGTTLFEDTVKAIAWTNTTWPQAVRTKALLEIKGVGPASVAYLQAMRGHYDRLILDLWFSFWLSRQTH